MLPMPILDLLQRAFPGQVIADLAPAYGGFSNLTVTATIGGGAWVIKAADRPVKRADLRREAAVLGALAQRQEAKGKGQNAPTISPPPPILLESDGAARPGAAEDAAHLPPSDAGWTVLAQRRLPGEPGLRLYERPPEALGPALFALGRALAELHGGGAGGGGIRTGASRRAPSGTGASHAPSVLPEAGADSGPLPTIAERAEATRAGLDALPLAVELRRTLEAALAHPVWAEGGLPSSAVGRQPSPSAGLAHGDAGLHNVLWHNGHITLIDWELAGRGSPLIDLGWVRWTMGFRSLPAALWGALCAGYGEPPELAADTFLAVAIGQIAGLLLRAHGRPAAWEEWVRRLRWTIAGGADGLAS